jgi:AcrR family transcriptional regulator
MLPPKRAYHSEKRQAQAQKTKDRILGSAKELFVSKGFEEVTIDEIANKAGVSAPSVYSLFQSKSGVLRALIDVALPQKHYESIVKKLEMEKSIAKRLELTAMLSRQLYDAERTQLGLFRDVSILNPELERLEIEREQRRYKRQEESFKRLAKKTTLLGGLNASKARDILWAFTGRDLYRMLVIERGWTSDEYEKWLTHMLLQTLLEPEDVIKSVG